MNWNSLKNNKCPKCNSLLEQGRLTHDCTKCEFKIGLNKFEEVVGNLYRPRPMNAIVDNQEGLNNM